MSDVNRMNPERPLAPAGSPSGGGAEAGASPDHPQPAGPVAILRGMTARQLKQPQRNNPFKEGTAERLLWLYGWGRKTWPKVREEGVRDASCETPRETAPGRNPKRGDYSELDDEVMRLTWDHLPRAEVAVILGRSVAGVANRALRLGLGRGKGHE